MDHLDREPVYHEGSPTTPEFFECPNCTADLVVTPGPDDGPTTVYRCDDCVYQWAD